MPTDAQPTDPIIAVFGADERVPIQTITVEEYRSIKGDCTMETAKVHREKQRRPPISNLWEGKDPFNGQALRLAWRKDRPPSLWLVSLYKKSKQVCSLAPDKLRETDDPESIAVKIMTQLAEDYQSLKIATKSEEVDLYEYRDKLIHIVGLELTHVVKRPASRGAADVEPMKAPKMTRAPTPSKESSAASSTTSSAPRVMARPAACPATAVPSGEELGDKHEEGEEEEEDDDECESAPSALMDMTIPEDDIWDRFRV